jgi:hypothetical protein
LATGFRNWHDPQEGRSLSHFILLRLHSSQACSTFNLAAIDLLSGSGRLDVLEEWNSINSGMVGDPTAKVLSGRSGNSGIDTYESGTGISFAVFVKVLAKPGRENDRGAERSIINQGRV